MNVIGNLLIVSVALILGGCETCVKEHIRASVAEHGIGIQYTSEGSVIVVTITNITDAESHIAFPREWRAPHGKSLYASCSLKSPDGFVFHSKWNTKNDFVEFADANSLSDPKIPLYILRSGESVSISLHIDRILDRFDPSISQEQDLRGYMFRLKVTLFKDSEFKYPITTLNTNWHSL